MVTADRFAKGMTFDQYVVSTATPENLAREASGAGRSPGWSDFLRKAYDAVQLSEAQQAAWTWLVGQPGGPARVLAIAEEWSSDCRRDIPLIAKVADTVGLELRIFPRDGRRFSRAPEPDPRESPNADLMAQYLNRRDGKTFQSIPVIVFFTRDMRELYRYIEFPAVYHKDRIRDAQGAPKPGETAEQASQRSAREFAEMLASPFFLVWRDAVQAEWLSLLYERQRVGPLA
ncbi:MAG TPA: thioredoxin family protein [Methylomirabilota bacterium]|nr:thioredoxin family protein [Methylomirabilota bacterium]